MSGNKCYKNREAVHRINYLYQAAEHARKIKNKDGQKLMFLYGSLVSRISKKTVTKLDHNLKRTMCKGCDSLLVPGDTALVRLAKKPQQQIIWICKFCGTFRSFNTRPEYEIWNDKKSSRVESVKKKEDEETKVCRKVDKLDIQGNKSK